MHGYLPRQHTGVPPYYLSFTPSEVRLAHKPQSWCLWFLKCAGKTGMSGCRRCCRPRRPGIVPSGACWLHFEVRGKPGTSATPEYSKPALQGQREDTQSHSPASISTQTRTSTLQGKKPPSTIGPPVAGSLSPTLGQAALKKCLPWKRQLSQAFGCGPGRSAFLVDNCQPAQGWEAVGWFDMCNVPSTGQ